jgi:ABC-type antimicrobial peptide transport system permease subunit
VQTLRVVGVARDIKVSSLVDGLGRSFVYVPLQQQYAPEITIVARGAPRRFVGDELRRLVVSMDPGLPVTTQTLEQSLALGQVPQRIAASMTGSLGVVGLLLASIGIYGVTAYTVTQRTREIGIRIALGARPRDMVLMVLRQGMTLAAAGSVAGLVLAAAAGQLLTAFLFGLPPLDPLVFGGATALFTIAGLIACYVPSRRASRVEPMVALRAE